MACADFKDLCRKTAAEDQLLLDKAFNTATNPINDGYQHGFTSVVYKFFDKKTSGSGITIENISNKQLAEELHKPVI